MTTEQERLLEEFTNAFENMDFDSFKSYVDKMDVNDDASSIVGSYLEELLWQNIEESDEIDDKIKRIVCLDNKFGGEISDSYCNSEELMESVEEGLFGDEEPEFNVFLFRLAAIFGGQEAVKPWFSWFFEDKELLYGFWGFTQENILENMDYAATLYHNPCWEDGYALPIANVAAECMRYVDDDSRVRMWRKVISFGDDFKDSTINHNTAKDILRFYLSTGYPCLNEEMLKQAKSHADVEGLANSYGLFEVLLKNGYEPAFDALLDICKRILSGRKSKKIALECLGNMAAIMPQRAKEIEVISGQSESQELGKPKRKSKKGKLKNADRITKGKVYNFPFIILAIIVVLFLCNISLCYYLHGLGFGIAVIAVMDLLVAFLFYGYATNKDTDEEYAKRYRAWRKEMKAQGDYVALEGFYIDDKGKAESGCNLFFSIIVNVILSLIVLF